MVSEHRFGFLISSRLTRDSRALMRKQIVTDILDSLTARWEDELLQPERRKCDRKISVHTRAPGSHGSVPQMKHCCFWLSHCTWCGNSASHTRNLRWNHLFSTPRQSHTPCDSSFRVHDREKKQILPFQVLSHRKRKNVDKSKITIQLCILASVCSALLILFENPLYSVGRLVSYKQWYYPMYCEFLHW